MRLPGAGPGVDDEAVAAQVEVTIKYAGYIDRQHAEIARHRAEEDTPIPTDFDYGAVRGLSTEVRQKLGKQRPQTVGQASRISGVTPAAVSLLLVHLRKARLATGAVAAGSA
jgi:tRNA uridine 5-carboxymethylaminomethyl modification enzyme